MPLPWKKTKITRFSQIVADLQSPKHGGSLVVETGFPTSLIDLFVKNRSRFQRRNSKKHLQLEISDPQPLLPAPPPSPSSLHTSSKVSPVRFVDETIHQAIHEDANSGCSSMPSGECHEVFDPMPSTTPSNSTNILVSVETTDSELHSSSSVRKDVHNDINGVVNSGRLLNRVCKSKPNMVLVRILNMLAMVVLILLVKKLNAAIILSAFVLLLFEFVGKRTVSCLNLKPCCRTNKQSRSLVSRVSCPFWFQAKKMLNYSVPEQQSRVHVGAAIELCSASSSIEEIAVVQATESEIDIRGELNSINRDQKLVSPEIEEDEPKREVADECKISEGRRKGKHRAELKSKMMKILVPRKLRATKKEKKEKKSKNKSEVLSSMEGVKSANFEIEDDQNVNRSRLACIQEDEENADCGTTCSIAESGRTDSAGNSECIILILIALSGLVGGRIIAVLCTMVGFFMIKMVKKTRGRSLNLSVNLVL